MVEAGSGASIEALLRALAPQVLGAVTRRAGDLGAAEDAVQEALLAAHLAWPSEGVPANPGGWLHRVAWRRLADRQAADAARREREALAGPVTEASEAEGEMRDDDALLLLFLCCHPALTPPSAIALTLRAVGGLSTAEIARAFLVPEATLAQRIQRAKEAIAAAGLAFEPPDRIERERRLASVLHVLYLMFNEGYAASAGPELVRPELSSEALRLARLLQALEPEHPETAGLLALLVLTDARRAARTGPSGELVPLHEQERARWDRAAIAEGKLLIARTLARGAVGPYQLQAAIAALHAEAPSVEATDWRQVATLYAALERLTANPLASLSRVVAEAMVQGPAHGLAQLAALEADARLAGHHRLEAVRAHLLERAGDVPAAIRSYRAAARRTPSVPERNYLALKAARLTHGTPPEGSLPR